MAARFRRSARASVAALIIMIALVCSAWLAFASSNPKGNAGYGVTTTTVCKPGYGFGDPNHCHTGPPPSRPRPTAPPR
jgi:hypothetical protein